MGEKLPTTIGETKQYVGGSSGKPVEVTKVSESVWEVRLYDAPQYRGRLVSTGGGFFDLDTQVSGDGAAVGGINLDWDFILDNY